MRREMQIPTQFRACAPRDVGFEITDEAPAALRYAVASYFAGFEAPIRSKHGEILCSCGATVTNIMNSFVWGLAHGEGFCGECGRPARGYHYVEDENHQQCLTLGFVLFYPLKAERAA